MSRYHAQPAKVRAAYDLLYDSASNHISRTAENCARFIVSWNNENACGWSPGTIVNRDEAHRDAIFTILHSLCAGVWYPPAGHVRALRAKFGI